MYFWNLEALKAEIARKGLTESRLFPYILLYAVLTSVFMELSNYIPATEPTFWTYVGSTLNIMIALLGTLYVYRANGGHLGKQFAAKYFSIGFVVAIRFLVYSIPVVIGLLILIDLFSTGVDETASEQSGPSLLIFSAWSAAYYLLLAKHMVDGANKRQM